MWKKPTHMTLQEIMFSVTLGLILLRITPLTEKHPHLTDIAIGCSATLTVCFYNMAKKKRGESERDLPESPQANASLSNSNLTNSHINASVTTINNRETSSIKFVIGLVVFVLLLIGVIYFRQQHHASGDCSSVSNGNAVANGKGSQAISGNCNETTGQK